MTNQDPKSLEFSPLLMRVRAALPANTHLYLVGGAVRDAFLGRETHDLDFTLPGDGLRTATQLADALGGAFYPLDDVHRTGRVILIDEDQTHYNLDFASFRGPDLESELRSRDFTINALAVDVHDPQQVIDPLKGVADIYRGLIRVCSPTAFRDDPVRILRAIRLGTALEFRLVSETKTLLRQAISKLDEVSPERIRDELFRILDSPRPATAIQTLDLLGVIPQIIPDLEPLKGLTQSHPHIDDGWTHTLQTLRKLELILKALGPIHDSEASGDLILGTVAGQLGRYRSEISDHIRMPFTPERTLRPLLLLAALYHDAGKPETMKVDENGKIRFYDHPAVGARIASRRAQQLRLSNKEIQRLKTIVRHHMRPLFLTQNGDLPSRRSIYRFFRDTESTGIDICLLSLADTLATYGPTLPQDTWGDLLAVVRALMEAWWEKRPEQVAPPALLRGEDLINDLEMQPGPSMGQLLEALREAQACGDICTKAEALRFAQEWLAERPP